MRPQGYRICPWQNRGGIQESTTTAQLFNRSRQMLITVELGRIRRWAGMALGLLLVIVALLTTLTGYLSPAPGSTPAQAVDGTTLLFLVMIVTSLNEFHYGSRWKANACRR
jgi:hypothetical protein